MIDRQTLAAVLDCLLSRGADFAEVFAEDTRRFSLHYNDRLAKRLVRGHDRGAGLRLLVGDRVVYAHTSDLGREALLDIAGALAAAGGSGAPGRSEQPGEARHHEILEVGEAMSGVPVGELLDFARRADGSARAVDPTVSQVSVSLSWSEREVLVANSQGVHAAERRSYAMASTEAVAAEGGQQQTADERAHSRTGLAAFRAIDPEAMARSAGEVAVRMLRAPHAPAGNLPAVIGNAFGGVIFHEACGHSLETTSVAKNSSVFSGKLGQIVAAECVTALDDGTLAGAWGTTAIDDEGTPTARTVLIERGVLKSYMVDRLGAIRTGCALTGSGRRESYRNAPTSRMRNTFIAAGKDRFDDMVASIPLGIYTRKMGGGSVNPATGEFNFAVREGYLIRDGRLAGPVRGASLIGLGQEVIRRIEMVGDDLTLDSGSCGSISGWVPVGLGQPALKVSEITVGGRS